jgi:hypothetical protein
VCTSLLHVLTRADGSSKSQALLTESGPAARTSNSHTARDLDVEKLRTVEIDQRYAACSSAR